MFVRYRRAEKSDAVYVKTWARKQVACRSTITSAGTRDSQGIRIWYDAKLLLVDTGGARKSQVTSA